MKKILALLISTMLVLGLFAGCGNNASTNIETTGATEGVGGEQEETPEKAGSLLVNGAAAVLINYGTDGLVLSLEGLNDDGIDLVASYEEELYGVSCTEAVRRVIQDCVSRNYMFEMNYVVVKQEKGSALPGTNFLDSIKSAAQGILDTAESKPALVMITEENLTEDGYIDLATAKILVEKFLEVEQVTGFDGTDKPVDGMYAFDVTYDLMTERLMVNAQTGSVSQGSTEELDQVIDEQEDNSAEETTPAEGLMAEATTPENTEATEG